MFSAILNGCHKGRITTAIPSLMRVVREPISLANHKRVRRGISTVSTEVVLGKPDMVKPALITNLRLLSQVIEKARVTLALGVFECVEKTESHDVLLQRRVGDRLL